MTTIERLDPMSLGQFIAWLDDHPGTNVPDLDIEGCYRGYYSDLALWPNGQTVPAGELAERLRRDALGVTFEGYKGGDFTMSDNTTVWIGQHATTAGAGRLVGLNAIAGRWISVADKW